MNKLEKMRLIQQKKIGILLIDARQKLHKSPEECAQLLHISTENYKAVEDGHRAIGLPELEVLAYYFRLPFTHFFSESLLENYGIFGNGREFAQAMRIRNKTLATKIKMRREERKLAPAVLAQKIGVSEEYLNTLESGALPIPLALLEQLAYALDLRIKDLQAVKGSIGRWHQQQELNRTYERLPEELQAFINNPSNEPYLRLAANLSTMSTDKLRAIAEGILEITF